MNAKLKREPVLIDQTRVADGLLFATHGDRARYLGTSSTQKPRWLKENADSFLRIDDILQAQLGPPVENEDNLTAAPAGPNRETSSRDVRKDRDDDVAALVDTLPGHCSPSYQPTSLPTPVKESIANGAPQTEPLPRDKATMGETKGPQTETNPPRATDHNRGQSGDRQRKKQKPSAGSSKSAPKLSLERMLIVLKSLRGYPILRAAAEKAGIHRRTLGYWLERSEAGDDGYDLEWQGEMWRFHEHYEAAIAEFEDELFAIAYKKAMGVKYPGSEAYLTPPNEKMMRLILEWKRPEIYGKRRKRKATQPSHVLVIDAKPAKKREYNTAASVRARQLKSLAKKIRDATD
jgi:hypothetical protein